MFGIRVVTPSLTPGAGTPEASAELRVGGVRLPFTLDLSRWSVRTYERQWKHGIKRIASGATSSALTSRCSSRSDVPHKLWTLWRVDSLVFVQSQSILVGELDAPFDPATPYAQVGERLPVTESALPLLEYSASLEDVIAAALDIRWPFAQ